jgi:hypothetical protein
MRGLFYLVFFGSVVGEQLIISVLQDARIAIDLQTISDILFNTTLAQFK